LTTNLRQDTIKGVFWSFIERFGTQFILLITQIILARLLLPYDFGLIGMLTIFIAISQVFVDSGFGNALIQKKNTCNKDYSTVFICNIFISIVLYIILYFTSPIISSFFEQKELKYLLRYIGLVLFFNSIGVVQFARFKKSLNFKIIAKSTLYANIISAIAGIGLAYLDYGVWALATQMVLIFLFRSLFFWRYSTWRPLLIFSKASFQELFNFGYKLLLSGLLDQLFQNIYILLIGKFYTANDVGYYTQAKKMQEVPVVTLAAIVGSVTFPTFSKIQDDRERLLLGFRKILKLQVFINFPLMIGLAVIADPLFLFLLGEKWLFAVKYFQLLCISGMLYTLHTTNLSILQVKGRTDLYLRLEVIKKIISILSIVISINWGILGLVYGRVIVSIISYFINAYYSGVLLDYPIIYQLKDLYPSMLISVIMGTIMLFISQMFSMSIVLFISQIIIGLSFYLIVAYFVKLEACIDTIKILKEFIPLKIWKKRKY
jgi:O-antigen/teichoic acid export membrane protein